MLVAHVVRLSGVQDEATAPAAADAVRVALSAPHDACCAAVDVDLSEVARMTGELVEELRALLVKARRRRVVLSVTAPRGTVARRVLEFHDRLGEPLPLVRDGRPSDQDQMSD